MSIQPIARKVICIVVATLLSACTIVGKPVESDKISNQDTQPVTFQHIRSTGFRDVRVLDAPNGFNGVRSIEIGQHGSDAVMTVRGDQLETGSGTVFQRPGFKSVYIADGTVWRRHVIAEKEVESQQVLIPADERSYIF